MTPRMWLCPQAALCVPQKSATTNMLPLVCPCMRHNLGPAGQAKISLTFYLHMLLPNRVTQIPVPATKRTQPACWLRILLSDCTSLLISCLLLLFSPPPPPPTETQHTQHRTHRTS